MTGRCVIALTLALIGISGVATAARAELPAEFVGMWRLVSYTQRFEDGTERQNPRSVAYITYAEPGHMCFVSMDPSRPRWKSNNRPTEAEALSAIEGFSAYCGTVEVNNAEGFVLHHVEIEETPNEIGITRKRWFVLEGNRLTLRADPSELRSPMIDSVLTWEKLQ